MEKQWLFERCNEIQENPDGYLDLWSREHYKSTIITFAKSIQDILITEGECTIGIFSHTRPIAKKFLSQIKMELESNKDLITLFPDILYSNPSRDAPRWSLDSGLVVKRKGNSKEATVEAWGLVDGQPTGSHFNRLIYDDVVTLGSVTTTDMIAKTTEALAISYNLGDVNGHVRRFIGTRYHFNDTYRVVMARQTAKPRLYPATDDGTFDGNPVLWEKETLRVKIRDMGSFVAACQLMQNPRADSTQGFKREWLKWYDDSHDGRNLNVYILCDPANSKKKKSDYTAMFVVGLGADKNYIILDMYRDKLSLTERTSLLFHLHKKWNPKSVGYERYGKDADISHIETVQERENYRFDVIELGGHVSKLDRIRRLLPAFENNRIYLPRRMHKVLHDGKTIDIVETFLVEEYDAFPVPVHDDCLDCLSRILDDDLNAAWPKLRTTHRADSYNDSYGIRKDYSWMSM